jgi:hypothetical protein
VSLKARVLIAVICLQVMPALLLQGCKVKVRASDGGMSDAEVIGESIEPARADQSAPAREVRDAAPSPAGAKSVGGSGGTAGRPRASAGENGEKGGAGAGGQGGAPMTVEICRVDRPMASAANSTIWMIVDGSGSMVEMLGDKTRWVALREALLDNMSGVIRALPQARWGMALYDGPLPGGTGELMLPDGGVAKAALPPATTCPRLVTVDPKTDNFAAINAAYPLDPLGGSTPTDRALSAVSAKLLGGATRVPDNMPTIVVLATDGAPNDFCSTDTSLPPADTRPAVITAAQKLAQAGVKTYVISLAGDDQVLTEHVNQVAQAGGTNKPFVPTNKTQLIEALRQIVSSDPNCDVSLNQEVDPLRACDGAVQIAGKELTCNGADGFGLRDPSTLRLAGAACTAYKADPKALKVNYPCDALR